MSSNTIRSRFRKVCPGPNRSAESHWCGTDAAARALHVSPSGVRQFANQGTLPHQQAGRARIFLKTQVLELAAKRARAALELVPAGLPPPREDGSPQQLALFRVRLKMAKAHSRTQHRNVGEGGRNWPASDKAGYVAR